jgi:F0F1-type ATP synthase assembly protein I
MNRKASQQTKLALALSAGTAFASSVIGGTLFGYWLDERLGTKPWLLIAGVVIGLFGALVWLQRIIARLQ